VFFLLYSIVEPLSDELQKVTLDILSNNICKDFIKPQKKFRDGIVATQICAGVLSGGKDTCQVINFQLFKVNLK